MEGMLEELLDDTDEMEDCLRTVDGGEEVFKTGDAKYEDGAMMISCICYDDIEKKTGG